MISLLPDDNKRDISAARTNVILLRYNIFTIAATSALALICLLFFIILSANQSTAVSRSTENEAKKAAFEPTKKAAEEYKNNLATAKTILDKNVDYTSVILEIVKLIPPGVVLDGLTLSAGDFGKQTTFNAKAKTIEDATKLKQNFQESQIFTNVYFQNVSNAPAAESANSYPIQVVLSVQLNKVVSQ